MLRRSMPILLLALGACAPVSPPGSAPGATPGAAAGEDAVGAKPAPASPVTSSTTAPPQETVIAGPGLGEASCKADAAQRFVGQLSTDALVKEAMAVSGAKTVRVVKPGMAVTMDYRGDRLNIMLDDNGKIASITCG